MPGAPASDLLDAYAAAGVEAPPMPVARGLGHGFDLPLVTHALPETAAAERLEPGMVFGLSAFVWESGVGAAYTQQPVVVGDHGAEPLATEPSTVPARTNSGGDPVTDIDVPSPEEIVRYEKDPETKIATITFDRPDQLNVLTIGARRRYGDLIFKASVDDDVKVLVVRGEGKDLGTGADLDELMAKQAAGTSLHEEYGIDPDEDVTMPNQRSYRAGAGLVHWYANPRAGCRSLQDFKKISILEVKGYCYGWHFYQAADCDLVVSSDDALFGHPAFRYVGYAPRMWQWATMMGLRKFQEMVFTGRPFTAEEMAECGFVNSVVPRDQLEAETAKYALACAADPTDRHRVHAEGVLRDHEAAAGRVHGQHAERLDGVDGQPAPRGRHRQAGDDHRRDDGRRAEQHRQGQRQRFPPDWRLSRSGRRKPE